MQQYLLENKNKKYIDTTEMTQFLYDEYPEYKRKKFVVRISLFF